jgi:hypothetical protein
LKALGLVVIWFWLFFSKNQNWWGRMVSEQTLKCLGQAGSNGSAPLILMPEQKLNPSYWCIWCTKNHLKETRIEKVRTPKVERVKNSKNKPQNGTKPVPKHPKNSLYVAIRV